MISQINTKYEEEYRRSIERLDERLEIERELKDKVALYSVQVLSFLKDMVQLEEVVSDEYFLKHSFEELLELNHRYYEDVTAEAYKGSFANPTYAIHQFGIAIGQIVSAVYEDIRQCVAYAFEHRRTSIFWSIDLFLDVLDILSENRTIIHEFYYNEGASFADDELSIEKELISLIRMHALKNNDDKALIDIFRKFDPTFTTYSQILTKQDLADERYIFKYGMYIGYNELELVKYFKQCDYSKLKKMADTYTEAFVRGFERNNVDLSCKKSVNIGYHIGYERVLQIAVKNFEAYNLVPLVYYDTKGSKRPRIMNTKPSKQMEYDHRFGDVMYLTEEWVNTRLKSLDKAYSAMKEHVSALAGPAIIEVFGEKPFLPESKAESIKYDDISKEIKSKFLNDFQQLLNHYLPSSSYSFTLNAYPVPEIGKEFNAIFDATIEVNTLDESIYMEVQQKIIQALDVGKYVRITGRNGNKTDLVIALNKLVDSETQTNFNNCTADVNVPVGEVFTTPRLEGTSGKLHVKEVYLHGLKFIDLEIDFKEGMMAEFTCKNFSNEDENINFVLENLTHPHSTLPLGEFAIGTNTKAYVMAQKYNIEQLLPILIGEKMGPHFAVGDTCYVWSEDTAVYNPDGREIVARDNSKSLLRKTDLDQAYTYCHTDITIPYTELDKIRVKTYENEWIHIIKEGRFVLEGTEILNEPLKEMKV